VLDHDESQDYPDYERPGSVWDEARRLYLSGVTAADICQQYGMSLRSFRMRARTGRWRRIDRADCHIEPEEGEFDPDDDVGLPELRDQVFLNLRKAVGRCRAAEATSWMRLFQTLSDRCEPREMADLKDRPPPVNDVPPPRLEHRLRHRAPGSRPDRAARPDEQAPTTVTVIALGTSVEGPDLSDASASAGTAIEAEMHDLHLLHPESSECTSNAAPDTADVSAEDVPGDDASVENVSAEDDPCEASAPSRDLVPRRLDTQPSPRPFTGSAVSRDNVQTRLRLYKLRSRRLDNGHPVADIDQSLRDLDDEDAAASNREDDQPPKPP
jgi:hypothetical protein